MTMKTSDMLMTFNENRLDTRGSIKNNGLKLHPNRCINWIGLIFKVSTISIILNAFITARCSGQSLLTTLNHHPPIGLDYATESKPTAQQQNTIGQNNTSRAPIHIQQVPYVLDEATIAPTNTINPNIETSILQFTVTLAPAYNESQTASSNVQASNQTDNSSVDYESNEYETNEEMSLDYEPFYSASTSKLLKEKKCSQQDLYEFASQIDEDYWSKLSNEPINMIRRRLNAYKKTRDDFCTPELVYGFLKLDSIINTTLLLDMEELANGLHAHNYKHCKKLFLHQCDKNQDGLLNDREWCLCFNDQTRLCHKSLKAEKRRLMETLKSHGKLLTRSLAKNLILSTYKPTCLLDGSFNTRQCDNNGICWCVDRRGVEYRGTRRNTRMGSLNSIDCSGYSDPARDELIRFTILNDKSARSSYYGHTGEPPIEPIVPLETILAELPDDMDNSAYSELSSKNDQDHDLANDISRNP